MPVLKYAKKEDIPQGWEADYEEKDGEFHFKAPEDGSGALKDALAEERRKREAAEKLAQKTAADLKKRELEDKAGKEGITSEKLAAIRAEVKAEIEAELAPDRTQFEQLKKENRALKLDNQVKKLAGEHGKFLAEKLDDYWKLHGDEFDLTDDGKPMVKANPGMSVTKLIEEHAKKRSEWVQGTKASGGGAAGQSGVPVTGAAITATDILANPSAALASARAAGKTE